MFFEELHKQVRTSTLSPLNHDLSGRFSRKGNKKTNKKFDSKIIDSVLVFIFTLSLLATDLILFAGSGNIELFKDSVFPIPEVLLSWAFFSLIIGVTVLLLHKYSMIKYGFASLIAFGFVYAVFTQFSQMQQNIVLGYALHLSSYMVCGFIFAGLTYIIFAQKYLLPKYLLTSAVFVLFIDVYVNYIKHTIPHEFIESHNSQKTSLVQNKRFVYFMFPNLVSYPYFSEMKIDQADKTKEIIQGFYKKNNFKIYTQAYAPEQEYLDNMVVSFNPLSKETIASHLLDTRLLSEYWRFNNLKNEYVYLKHNQLYDIFRKNKFQISAYKSRDFDMCHAKHKFNVNRCIEKVNQPANIYSMSLSTWQKTKILLVEWLSSWHLFTNMSSLYHALATVIDADKVPMVGVNYNNLYVVNSIKTFDILLNDMSKDSGRQAYFVFADIPSNMYIYDEFCQLKPQEKWLDMANLPWIQTDYTLERQTAYLEQTRCLYGKLEQFIDKLKKQNLWDDTIIVIQGISGVNNFKNYNYTGFLDNFIANRLVTMAIHDKNIKNTQVDNELCATNNILTKYLFKPNSVCDRTNLGIHNNLYDMLRQKLDILTIGADVDYTNTFEKWYKNWQDANEDKQTKEADIYKKDNSNDELTNEGIGEISDETAIECDFGLDDLKMPTEKVSEQVKTDEIDK